MAAVVAVLVAGCIGTGGSSASPPSNPEVVAKDSRVVVTWTMSPGVDYWIYRAAASDVTPDNCSSLSQCGTSIQATSPSTVWGLSNNQSYSFSINGRVDGGPGGAGSVAINATPGIAGKKWNVGAVTDTGTSTLRGVAYGASGTKFVAVGVSGALFSGTVSNSASTGMGEVTWTPMTNPISGTDFNAVSYDTSRAKFYSVGSGGAVIQNIPASSTEWTPLASNTTEALYAIASDGAGNLVATGANGRVIYSSDGTAWTSITYGTSALYGVTYGNSTTNGNVFVAVGAGGKILWSDDKGVTWHDATNTSTEDLKAVTYGGIDSATSSTTSVGVFVAVGANGTVLTSVNGVDWTLQTGTSIPSTTNLNGITISASRRFVAVGDAGKVFFSGYAITNAGDAHGMEWSSATEATTSPLYAVTTGGMYDYCSVGASGTNLYADLAD